MSRTWKIPSHANNPSVQTTSGATGLPAIHVDFMAQDDKAPPASEVLAKVVADVRSDGQDRLAGVRAVEARLKEAREAAELARQRIAKLKAGPKEATPSAQDADLGKKLLKSQQEAAAAEAELVEANAALGEAMASARYLEKQLPLEFESTKENIKRNLRTACRAARRQAEERRQALIEELAREAAARLDELLANSVTLAALSDTEETDDKLYAAAEAAGMFPAA